jgi:hypothetical protein
MQPVYCSIDHSVISNVNQWGAKQALVAILWLDCDFLLLFSLFILKKIVKQKNHIFCIICFVQI